MNSSFSHKKSPKIFRNLRLINPDKKVVYCKKCVLSNQRPRTMFNEEGICAPCLYAEFKKTGIDWDKREKELETRRKELESLLAEVSKEEQAVEKQLLEKGWVQQKDGTWGVR
mgnify:CR=1 FL=1